MKQVRYRLFTVALAAMLMAPFFAQGQDAIYELPGISAPSKTIVREFQKDIAIVYAYDGTDGYFWYVDMSTLNSRYAVIPGLNVSDFEIFKESVYFCGNGIPGNIVGYFDIYSTFFSGAPAQFAVMPSSMICNYYPGTVNYEDIVGLKKLEVMDNIVGEPHIFLIGEATCTHSNPRINRCIIEVYYDCANTTWKIAMTQEHESIFYFDDIAVTDNYVVSVGHKHPHDGEYTVGFPRQSNPCGNIFDSLATNLLVPIIFNHPVYDHGGVGTYVMPFDKELLVEHLSGDIFATVAHGGYPSQSGIVWGTVLDICNTVANVMQRYHVTDTSSEYKDLKYNKQSNSLYFLPGAVLSTLPDGYIEFGFDSTFKRLKHVNKHWNSLGVYEGSLDAAPHTLAGGTGQSLVTSMTSSKLYLWRHMPNTGCSSMEKIIPANMIIKGGMFPVDFPYVKQAISFVNYYPSVESDVAKQICGENKTDD